MPGPPPRNRLECRLLSSFCADRRPDVWGLLRAARRGQHAAWAGYAVALALLLFKAALNHNPVWEYQWFGWWPHYVFLQSYLIFPLGLACLGLAAGILPPGRSRRAVTILAGFLVLVSLWTERWMFVEPDTRSEARGGSAILTVNKVHSIAVHFHDDTVTVRDPAVGVPKTISFEKYVERYGVSAVVVEGN